MHRRPENVWLLVLTIGMAADSSILTLERFREEIRCTFFTMANRSINRVFIRTLNTTLTSLIPVAAMLFGGETLKDFAFAMACGL